MPEPYAGAAAAAGLLPVLPYAGPAADGLLPAMLLGTALLLVLLVLSVMLPLALRRASYSSRVMLLSGVSSKSRPRRPLPLPLPLPLPRPPYSAHAGRQVTCM
jgi:hypothetical protein